MKRAILTVMQHRSARFVLAALLLAGCSSDAAPAPDADITTPGAFVATGTAQGFGLFRTLATYQYASDKILAIRIYDVNASTEDEAREVAKGSDIPFTTKRTLVVLSRIPDPHSVVWFRTLTAEETALP
jgi:hypothetical protein